MDNNAMENNSKEEFLRLVLGTLLSHRRYFLRGEEPSLLF